MDGKELFHNSADFYEEKWEDFRWPLCLRMEADYNKVAWIFKMKG